MICDSRPGRFRDSCSKWSVAGVLGLSSFLILALPLAARAGFAPQLSTLLRQSSLVVAGDVTEVQMLDENQLAVARLRTKQVFKGKTVGETICVVELRGVRTDPGALRAGTQLVGFLKPSKATSYLRQHVGPEPCFEAANPRSALLATDSEADGVVLRETIDAIVTLNRRAAKQDTQRSEVIRRIVFGMISTSHPLLVADGAASLSSIRDLAESLRGDEQDVIETAMSRETHPPHVRIEVIKGIAAADLKSLVPALKKLDAAKPVELQAAVWAALERLGTPLTPEELADMTRSTNPGERQIAVKQLLLQRGVDAVSTVGAVATNDSDSAVRIAAIDALGESKLPQALSPLEQAFPAEDLSVRQASLRAITSIGGQPAKEAFGRLVFVGPQDAQKLAVMGLLLLPIEMSDPILERIRKTHPDEKIREIATHGVDLHVH